MDLLDAIRTRRSVKHYDPEHKISDEEIRHLFEYVALTPSSFNMQNWHFVAVRDQDTQDKLCAASWNQAQVKDASLTVILCGSMDAYKKVDRFLRLAPDDIKGLFTKMIPGFYEGNDRLLRDEACRSIGLAGMNMMLMAKEMGYDSCPLIGFDPKQVSEICSLPENQVPLMMVTIGKGLEPARPRMGLLNLEEIVSFDTFGNHQLKGEVNDA